MVQCECCLCWQHAHCMHFDAELDVPKDGYVSCRRGCRLSSNCRFVAVLSLVSFPQKCEEFEEKRVSRQLFAEKRKTARIRVRAHSDREGDNGHNERALGRRSRRQRSDLGFGARFELQ